MLVNRFSVQLDEIRLLEVFFHKRTLDGNECPNSKHVVRRQRKSEKFLVLYKGTRWNLQVVAIIEWEAMEQSDGDVAYHLLRKPVSRYGISSKRGCEFNANKTCDCQGQDHLKKGSSVVFGCTKAPYTNVCKFSRSNPSEVQAMKFTNSFSAMAPSQDIENVKMCINNLASVMGKKLNILAPLAFERMSYQVSHNVKCRLGFGEEEPFSACSVVSDYSAHYHLDKNNVTGGTTLVFTLLNRKSSDKQYHILPFYSRKPGNSEGLALELEHCSALLEVAGQELHGTSRLKKPNRQDPSRISVVFFQHQNMNLTHHGNLTMS